jgi:thioredoxin-like negative regulator of GroEL
VPAGLRVRATPTLVLVNAQGQVLAAWEGVGPEKQQQQIAKTIQSIVN